MFPRVIPAPHGGGGHFWPDGLLSIGIVFGYVFCVAAIIGTFQTFVERGQARWPIPIVLAAMAASTIWTVRRYQVTEFGEFLFFAIPACGIVGIVYLAIVEMVEKSNAQR